MKVDDFELPIEGSLGKAGKLSRQTPLSNVSSDTPKKQHQHVEEKNKKNKVSNSVRQKNMH
ncbi:MAG: hypothetical protein U0X41_03160 [Chitinophagales bacterium]